MKRILLIIFIVHFFLVDVPNAYASSWESSSPLPYGSASSTAFPYLDRLYILGGGNTDVTPFHLSNNINADGSLQSWTQNDDIRLYFHTQVIKNDLLYVLGGADFPGPIHQNIVRVRKINQDGSLSDWNILNSLPSSLSLGGSTLSTNQDKIYFAGGFNGGFDVHDEIYAADIQQDGTIGSWTQVGNLPQPLIGFGMFAMNNKLLIIGGVNSSGNAVADVSVADIAQDGSVGSWTSLPSLPRPIGRPGITQAGDTIILAGGQTYPLDYVPDVYYAKVSPEGLTGNWETSSSPLPFKNCCSPLVAAGNYLYFIGGHDGASYFDTVLKAKISDVIPVSPNLNVPLLKQTDSPWGSQVYDHANIWNPGDPSIARWGCTLTSAVMILLYHGIQNLPDNSPLDPASLNTWLKSQPDGYIDNGLINMQALARLSKLAKDSGHNPQFAADALEYTRLSGAPLSTLTADLEAGNPAILEEPGHFVVAKGVVDTTFSINDPFFSRENLLDGYNNTFLSLRRFTPSHTDLSSIMAVTNKDINLALFDFKNEPKGDSFLDQPLTNDLNSQQKSGKPLKELLFAKPDSGEYKLTLSSQKTIPYSLTFYLYDQDGNLQKTSVDGYLSKGKNETLSLSFNHANSQLNTNKKVVTFDTLIDDLNEAISLKQINKPLGKALINLAKTAKKSAPKNKLATRVKLDVIQLILNTQKGRLVQMQAHAILSEDVALLKQSL